MSLENLSKLADNLDDAIRKALDNKDPDLVILLMDIRRDLMSLCSEVRGMKKILDDMVKGLAMGSLNNEDEEIN
jgi:hypothetical protein